jgi:general secretion pathway protein F/type IV pilus assembly protein PilC
MLYKYSGIDANGKKTKSTLEAISLEDAKAKLKSKKIIFTSINQTASYQNINFNFIKKIRNLELSMVSKDISLLLKSGISLGKAMLILKKQYYKNQKLSLFFESINNSLNEGKTFYQSLSLQKNFKLPEFYMQSIKTSEDGGMLSGVLWELSLFLKEQDRISKQISSALLYPLFLLSVSIVMIGFLLSYIVPQIVGVFTTSNQELPKITNFVIWFSSFITNNYHIILLLMVGVISIGIAGYNRSYSFKRNIDSIMLKIPFIGIMIQSNNLSRFCYIASVLLNSGVSFAQAVKLSSNTSASIPYIFV